MNKIKLKELGHNYVMQILNIFMKMKIEIIVITKIKIVFALSMHDVLRIDR